MSTVNLNRATANFSVKENSKQISPIIKWFNKQAINFENTRFGMMSMYIIIQSCIAAIAAMYILKNDAHILFLCITSALAMASNGVFIAQGSAKLCLAVLYLSLIVNVIFILVNI